MEIHDQSPFLPWSLRNGRVAAVIAVGAGGPSHQGPACTPRASSTGGFPLDSVAQEQGKVTELLVDFSGRVRDQELADGPRNLQHPDGFAVYPADPDRRPRGIEPDREVKSVELGFRGNQAVGEPQHMPGHPQA